MNDAVTKHRRTVARARGRVMVAAAALAAAALLPTTAASGRTAQSAHTSVTSAHTSVPAVESPLRLHLGGGQPAVQRKAVNNMTYHGGPVMQYDTPVPFFWMPSRLQDGTTSTPAANYQSTIYRYFQDIRGSKLFGVATQYYQTTNGTTEYINNCCAPSNMLNDTRAYPAVDTNGACGTVNGSNCVNQAQVLAELTNYISAHHLNTGLSNTYFVYLAPNEAMCRTEKAGNTCFVPTNDPNPSGGDFCGFHGSTGSQPIVYAVIPYGGLSSGCAYTGTTPNGAETDSAIRTTSHEHFEAATDPEVNVATAWNDDTAPHDEGGEMADKCGSIGPGYLDLDGGLANQQLNGHYYELPYEWSNAVHNCVRGRAPLNDAFGSAASLGASATGTTYGTTDEATAEAGEPLPAGGTGGHTIWFSYVPQHAGTLTVNTCGSAFDTTLAIYSGSSVNGLRLEAQNDDASFCGVFSGQSRTSTPVGPGRTYWIQVDSYRSSDWGAARLAWKLAPSPPNPTLLWYDANAGAVFTSSVANGVYKAGTTLSGFRKGWTDIAISRDTAVFFDASSHQLSTGLLSVDGHYTQRGSLQPLYPATRIAATCDSAVTFFPGANTAYGYALNAGLAQFGDTISVPGNYDTIVGSCDSVLFYSTVTGAAYTAVLAHGVWTPGTTLTLSAGWNRITASDDSILFMNTANEHQAYGTFRQGVFTQVGHATATPQCANDRLAATADSLAVERFCGGAPYALTAAFTQGLPHNTTNIGSINTRWTYFGGAH